MIRERLLSVYRRLPPHRKRHAGHQCSRPGRTEKAGSQNGDRVFHLHGAARNSLSPGLWVLYREFETVDLWPWTVSAGLSFAFGFFDHDSLNWTWQIAELFKIEKGNIRRIEAIFHRCPYGMNSGWSTYEQGMSDQIQSIR